ncbi:MAG TPA: folylpolyglutamate synthase/dihydrofolate synthase family protein [Verrucomicrobiae bacterium]|jgi:dihydrofolate synthase/folylpolyglutamate synthase|nr:folylpolyglutamate synthase/dihydrofolate synthase family protein [Verrucomicrobiae bacterium]
MAYAEAIQFLYSLRLFGANFGLDNTLKLANFTGNPQKQLRFIHVAGTNGKGSTCAILESIYRASGLRVGLFTSPHLVSFRERIQINRQFISEAEVTRLVMELKPLLEKFPTDHHPTFFEAVTIMALRHFADQKCDLVIWETGLGGRLDATNIVTPLASVITNISIEHSEWLGDTVEKIAAEKAGIIKPGVPIVTTATAGHGLEVIAFIAREKHSALTVVDAAQTNRPPLDSIELPLHGPHQRLNAALALATVQALSKQLPVTDAALRSGLVDVIWPGRMHRVQTVSGQTILLDGAHNADGAEALRIALQEEFPDSRPAMIFGVFRDKDSTRMCHSLAPLAGRILLTPVQSERSEDPSKLVAACRESNPRAAIEVCGSLSEALQKISTVSFVVIAGSLYLVGEAMELLHLVDSSESDEKELNEWFPKR